MKNGSRLMHNSDASKISMHILTLTLAIFASGMPTIQADLEDEVSSRLVVTFQTPQDNVLEGVDLSGVTVVKQYGRRLVLDLRKPFDLDTEEKYFKSALKSVQSVEPDYLIGLQQTEMSQIAEEDTLVVTAMKSEDQYVDGASISSATQSPLWNLMDSEPFSIHVESVWQVTNSTPDVVVAVIDTGIADPARGLFLNLLDGYDFISDDGISIDEDGRDPDATDPGDWGVECPIPSWHGTRVASILAARHDNEFGMKGVAQNCSVLPVRVLGLCRMGYATDVTDSIVWAAGGGIKGIPTNSRPAKIISLSLAGQGKCPGYLQSAINQALLLGAVVVSAAGNSNLNVSGYFPANCDGVISVAASTREGKLAGYSNWGDLISVSAPGGDSANAIMAITVDETESGMEVAYCMGTSFATPHVSGILSLIRQDINISSRTFYQMYVSITSQSSNNNHQACNIDSCAGRIISSNRFNVPKVMGNSKHFRNSCAASTATEICADFVYPIYECLYSCTCPGGYKYVYLVDTVNQYAEEGCVPCDSVYYPPAKTCSPGGYFPSASGPMNSSKWCNCTLCGNGDYCTGNIAPRMDCPAGVYCILKSVQVDCPAGRFCPARSFSPSFCPPGTYSLAKASVCTACVAGKYSTYTGATAASRCTSCTSGTYSQSTGASICTQCIKGTYTTATNTISCTQCGADPICSPNEFLRACSPTSKAECSRCNDAEKPADSFWVWSETVQNSCIWACDQGFFKSKNSTCQPCKTPDSCEFNQYTTACNSTADGLCLNCFNKPPNAVYTAASKFYAVSDCSWSCNDGYRKNAVESTCEPCPAGTYAINSPSTCSACPIGTYSSYTTASMCLECAIGTYSSDVGTTSCTMCIAGTYSSSTSSSVCSMCDSGTYSTSIGSSTCTKCTACTQDGHYTVGCSKTSSGTCTKCSNSPK